MPLASAPILAPKCQLLRWTQQTKSLEEAKNVHSKTQLGSALAKKATEEVRATYKARQQNTLQLNSWKPRNYTILQDAFGMFLLLPLTHILPPYHQRKATGKC